MFLATIISQWVMSPGSSPSQSMPRSSGGATERASSGVATAPLSRTGARSPNGAVARCQNGLYVWVATGDKTCTGAGGVAEWYSEASLLRPTSEPRIPEPTKGIALEIDVLVRTDRRAVIRGRTNLPEDESLIASVQRVGDTGMAQTSVSVSGGNFESEPLGPLRGLEPASTMRA